MTDYKHPGIYIQEQPSGPGPITGISTSNLGLIGFSTKGPIDTPKLATSFAEWARMFGSFTNQGLSAHEAYAFFANGGQFLYFVRTTAPDATKAGWDFVATELSEDLGGTVQPTGVYSFDLDRTPVAPSFGMSLVFPNAATPANVYWFVSDANGVLSLDPDLSGATALAAGGSGTVDPETGEIHVELGNPALFTGGSNHVTASYSYVVFRFVMKWPGLAGNDYRVVITPGGDDYLIQSEARWTRFTVQVQELSDGVYAASEQFADLVFDDPDDPNYICTVMNADSGSDILSVLDFSNSQNPAALAGAAVVDEDISGTQVPQGSTATPPVAYDGLVKAWDYELGSAPFQKTVHAAFTMADGKVLATGAATSAGAALTDSGAAFVASALVGKVVVNLTQGFGGPITANTATTITATMASAWVIGDRYAVVEASSKIGLGSANAGGIESVVSPGSVSAPAQIVPGTVSITFVSGGDTYTVLDDGAGNLGDGVLGSCATINYANGQITSTGTPATANQIAIQEVGAWSALTVDSGTEIKLACVYAVPVRVEDDADGNMIMSAAVAGQPSKFVLNTAVSNTVSYNTGEMSLTWKVLGNPAAGPSGALSQVVSYRENPTALIVGILTGGLDGSDVSSADLVDPELAIDARGIFAFGKVDAMMQLVAADFQTDTYVSGALVDYAELVKDKFVILTAPHGLTYQEVVNWKKFQLMKYTSYAALYYPHIKILDPVTNVNADIPCGGHVAGIYARTDSIRNVGEAPAGMEKGKISWAVGLELDLSDNQVGILYENKVNCLVQWPHTGRVVWGARTLDAAGGQWPYIQMRRLFMFVEKSVFNSTHVHVFENNGPTLWNRIRSQVATFLRGLHDSGYLAGSSPDESFFVVCDRSNNPQNTVDQGLVFCDVGIAANKPAEFIVFRFQQKALAA